MRPRGVLRGRVVVYDLGLLKNFGLKKSNKKN